MIISIDYCLRWVTYKGFVHRQCLKATCWIQGWLPWKESYGLSIWHQDHWFKYTYLIRSSEDQVIAKMIKAWSEEWPCNIWAYWKHILRKKILWTFTVNFKTSSLWRNKNWFEVDQVEAQIQDEHIENCICFKLVI
jgi:hypothetical protein